MAKAQIFTEESMSKPGGYTLTFEADLCRMSFWGHINEQHAREMMQKQSAYAKDKPYLLSICDLKNFDSVSPEARKVFSETADSFDGRGSAFYGASFQARVVATLVMKAASLFAKKENPFQFYSTEAEAMNWINERRKVLLAELQGGRHV
jgi:hypothetical protein